MNELALFAGAGGGILGARLLGWRTVCAVEIDPRRRESLLRRQEEGHIEPFPIWDDIRTFHAGLIAGEKVDVITAGFPCQPWSTIGPAEGRDSPKNLWPETVRVIREVEPEWCLLENVTGLLNHEYFGQILQDLAEGGRCVRWDCVPASALGAPHPRDRVWIVANAKEQRWPWVLRRITQGVAGAIWPQNSLDSRCDTVQRLEERLGESSVFGTPYGRAAGVDRLGAAGAMQVPAVVRTAWELLT